MAVTAPELNSADRTELADLVRQLSVVFGRVTLSSGKEADYYVDLRRATLHHRAAPLIGRLMRELTDDWIYSAVGGLTLGADPVATAIRPRRGGDSWTRSSCARSPSSTDCSGGSKVRMWRAAGSWRSRTPPPPVAR